MAYEKPFTTVQDFPLGYQSVNRLRDNNVAMNDLWDLRHSIGTAGYAPVSDNPLDKVGRHDDILVARTVAQFQVDTTTLELVPLITGPMLPVFTVTRIQVGEWIIYVRSRALFGAVATVKATASGPRKATCQVRYAQAPNVIVNTWDVATATRGDYDFTLTMWAEYA